MSGPSMVRRLYHQPLAKALLDSILEPLFRAEPFAKLAATDSPPPEVARYTYDNFRRGRQLLALRLKWLDKLNVWLAGDDKAVSRLRLSMCNCKLNGAGFDVVDARGAKFCDRWVLCPWCRMRVALQDGSKLLSIFDPQRHSVVCRHQDVFPADRERLVFACGGISHLLQRMRAFRQRPFVSALWVVTPKVLTTPKVLLWEGDEQPLEPSGRVRGWSASVVVIRSRNSNDTTSTEDLIKGIANAFSYSAPLWHNNRDEFAAILRESRDVRMRYSQGV